jgi:hypothetical protein
LSNLIYNPLAEVKHHYPGVLKFIMQYCDQRIDILRETIDTIAPEDLKTYQGAIQELKRIKNEFEKPTRSVKQFGGGYE